jgi:hypothetical protein
VRHERKEAEMGVPAHAELATRIVFVGSSRDELLEVVVDQRASAAAEFPSSGFSELTRDGLPIWVNVANVLYLESVKVLAG